MQKADLAELLLYSMRICQIGRHIFMRTTACVYAINVTQKVFDGRGNVNVPHSRTISGSGSDKILADFICRKYERKRICALGIIHL